MPSVRIKVLIAQISVSFTPTLLKPEGNPAKLSANVVVLNSLDKQCRKIGSSLALFAINFNKVEKQLNKLSMLVDKLDIYSLEMFVAMHCLLYISADIEAANYIVVEILNNLLLLSAEVLNNAQH
jgi:hypothetical protein